MILERRPLRVFWPLVVVTLCMVLPCYADIAPGQSQIKLAPVVEKLLDDPVVSQAQKRRLALFHGQWDNIEQPTLAEQAVIALGRYDLSNPVLINPQAPPLVRARAALLRGEPDRALEMLQDDDRVEAVLIRAEAHQLLGRFDQTTVLLVPIRERLHQESITDPAQLTAATQALVLLAGLEGRPDADYQLAMSLFARVHQQLDRLYWPALVHEANLLITKDNPTEATQALSHALTLNPRCGEAWYQLGRLAARGYQFDAASSCVEALRETHPTHLLADQLEAHIYLTQKDPASAFEAVERALDRYPRAPDLLALGAAAKALAYDQDGLDQALGYFIKTFPRSPKAHYTVGRYLSLARQYPQAAEMLQEAIRLDPNWPAPRIELGLLLMQAGDEDAALVQLQRAVDLDPFNRRAANQLKLAQQLSGYQELRSPHFVIKYRAGIDEALAADMHGQLEEMYRHVTSVYEYRPPRPTVIEILPDEKTFGVRITGMPDIWTIAACTGDVIALTPPREGAKQRGPFDWWRVISHEFVHTVTLNLTQYRIPHWFTEACAVWLEPGQRDYSQCELLAWAVKTDNLFDLDQINWAFVRPRNERDRPLAYAQASWMVEYLTEHFGHDAVLALLHQYRQAVPDQKAIRAATGVNADQFMAGFKDWARQQVRDWGLGALPDDPRIRRLLKEYKSSDTFDPQLLRDLLEEHPDQPDLLKVTAEEAMTRGDDDDARAALLRYQSARPVDPWVYRKLISLAVDAGHPLEAIAALENLDAQDVGSGQWALQLAKIYRDTDQLDLASGAITRVLHRHPYDANHRELAATIELQRGDTDAALRHLKALTTLEPDRAMHHVRLAALYAKMGQPQAARQAARAAQELDPDAPVDRFLQAQP